MRRTLAALAVSATSLVSLTLAVVPAHADGTASAGVRWDLDGTRTLLAQLPGSTQAQPVALNDANTAVGFAAVLVDGLTEGHAVRWDAAGHATDLGVLPGDVSSTAIAINNDGVAIGNSDGENYLERHAVRWNADGTATRLADLPGIDSSAAMAINSHGTVVGWSGERAVRWSSDGTATALPVPAGTRVSHAIAIADSGWITGYAAEEDDLFHVLRWNAAGRMTELGAPGNHDNMAVAVTEDGSVAANSDDTIDAAPTDSWVSRWDPSAHHVTKLPHRSDNYLGYAFAMNDNRVVVGYVSGMAQAPARWNADGTLTELPGRGYDSLAVAINNANMIAGRSHGQAVRWSATGALTTLGVPAGYTQSEATAINAGGSVLGYGFSD